MLASFFTQAAVSTSRQRVLRGAMVVHVALLAYGAWTLLSARSDLDRARAETMLGYLLLTAGIVEGALLIGWRLTQLPKSQALEFLLVTPLRAERVLVAEALVGVGRLALVTLAGLPVLALLLTTDRLVVVDLFPLIVMPFTWGVLAGLTLTTWAYESLAVRRWGERLMIVALLVYLTIGVLAGENLVRWLAGLPEDMRVSALHTLRGFHEYNPFGTVSLWFTREFSEVWPPALLVQLGAIALAVLLMARCACRLKGHFHDRHYRPITEIQVVRQPPPDDGPLSWWATRRVSEYSGQINLWLAGGFCLIYAIYIVAGAYWPDWLGKRVFELADQAGGVPVLGAALVVLAAVPAAFQYGLWDSNAQERCRRLELLLLTRLEAADYWRAAAAAAWLRGRGYFGLALVLWTAAVGSGMITLAVGVTALAAAVILWGLYFALGFRDFARGRNAHAMGLFLTLGLPLLAYAFAALGWPTIAALVPPGSVSAACREPASWMWLTGVVSAGSIALAISRRSLARCDADLRKWYDQQCGRAAS